MRVAVYVRVSTINQVHDQTIEQQLDRLQQYCQQQGWSLPTAHIFRDDGFCGASLKRLALDRLRDKVHYRELDCLLDIIHNKQEVWYNSRMIAQYDYLHRP